MWTVSPALTVVLALSVSPSAPLLLAAGLMVAAAAGLWALPAGWEPDGDDHDGVSKGRTLARAWPIFVTGAASVSLFALVELTLPALLHQRAIHVGWAGPLLAGFSIAAILGATLYAARGSWPGSLRVQSMVLLLGSTGA